MLRSDGGTSGWASSNLGKTERKAEEVDVSISVDTQCLVPRRARINLAITPMI
jgi:hypothetical protein